MLNRMNWFSAWMPSWSIPDFDPHGDPIPDEKGNLKSVEKKLLSELNKSQQGVCVGVRESNSEFLRYLDKRSIGIGTKIVVLSKEYFDGSMVIQVAEQQFLHITKNSRKHIRSNHCRMRKTLVVLITITALAGCKQEKKEADKLQVVTTTTMISDLVQQIGGDEINVQGLMGAGVDPHLYKASEGDVSKLYNADIIFYNGLHLEGKLVEVFEKMETQNKTQVALAEQLDKNGLIGSEYFASNYDPHVWFDIGYFKEFARAVEATLAEADPGSAKVYAANLEAYLEQLDALENEVETIIQILPVEQRVLGYGSRCL